MIGSKLILLSSLVFMSIGSCSPSTGFSSSTSHVHQYGEYSKDEWAHWRTCSVCGEEERGEHHFEALDIDYQLADRCTVCGYTHIVGDMFEYTYNEDYQGYVVSASTYFNKNFETLEIPTVYQGQQIVAIGSFAELANVKKIVVPDGIRHVLGGAFSQCPNLETVELPDTVETLGNRCFANNPKLKSVRFSPKIREIPEGLFEGSGIESITIPKGIECIQRHAFTSCVNLTSIEVEEGNETFSSHDGVLYNKDQTQLVVYPGGRAGAFEIPDTVTSLAITCFEFNLGLTSVKLSSGIKTIGERAFFRCENLVEASIPEGVEVIDTDAFYGCTSLTQVTFPSTLKSVGDWAFMHCTSLTSVSLPKACEHLGLYTFNDCPAVTKYEVASGNPNFFTSQNCLYAHVNCLDEEAHFLMQIPRSFQGLLKIPEGIEHIDNFSISETPGITGIIIPTSLKYIYDPMKDCPHLSAFYYAGTAEEWQDVVYSESTGEPLHVSLVYYYSKNKPTDVPNPAQYWHYVDGLPTNWN